MNEASTSVMGSNGIFNNHLWIIEIVVGIVSLIIFNYLFKQVVKYFRQKSISQVPDWRQKLDRIFFLPVQILLWILGGILVLEISGKRYGFSPFEDYLHSVRSTVIVVCFTWIFLRWKKEVLNSLLEKDRGAKKVDAAFAHAIGKFLTASLVVISAMILFQIWGLNVLPLVAFGGIGAASVGFAGKDVIANFFGGMMIYITRPFMTGDWISLPERNFEGQIEEIGWYLTSIRDRDKRPVYLPNAIFTNALVVNFSRMSHRRIEARVGVRFKDVDKIKNVTQDLKQAISQHGSIDPHLPALVNFTAFGPYAMELSIDVYTLATRYDQYLAVKQEILLLAYEIITSRGAQIPYPTSAVLEKGDYGN